MQKTLRCTETMLYTDTNTARFLQLSSFSFFRPPRCTDLVQGPEVSIYEVVNLPLFGSYH